MEGCCASLSESGLAGLRFVRIAVFAITGDFAKTSLDERLPIKDEPAES